MELEQLKYPIGKYNKTEEITPTLLQAWISDIAVFPKNLRVEVESLSDTQLETAYREGGWTIRQLVNHCADSHMNSLMRFKLALTEEQPTIKSYFEDRWAALADSKNIPIEPALKMLDGLHERWVVLLQSLSQEQLARTFIHPDSGRQIRLVDNIGLYAWHCKHHLAHITNLKSSMDWV